MEQLMSHLNDETFSLHLVRYHNSNARNGLRDLDLYIQMLLARFENSSNGKRRVTPAEIEIIKTTADDILHHFIVAEEVVNSIAAYQHQTLLESTISETEDMSPLGGFSRAMERPRKSGKEQPQTNNART